MVRKACADCGYLSTPNERRCWACGGTDFLANGPADGDATLLPAGGLHRTASLSAGGAPGGRLDWVGRAGLLAAALLAAGMTGHYVAGLHAHASPPTSPPSARPIPLPQPPQAPVYTTPQPAPDPPASVSVRSLPGVEAPARGFFPPRPSILPALPDAPSVPAATHTSSAAVERTPEVREQPAEVPIPAPIPGHGVLVLENPETATVEVRIRERGMRITIAPRSTVPLQLPEGEYHLELVVPDRAKEFSLRIADGETRTARVHRGGGSEPAYSLIEPVAS